MTDKKDSYSIFSLHFDNAPLSRKTLFSALVVSILGAVNSGEWIAAWSFADDEPVFVPRDIAEESGFPFEDAWNAEMIESFYLATGPCSHCQWLGTEKGLTGEENAGDVLISCALSKSPFWGRWFSSPVLSALGCDKFSPETRGRIKDGARIFEWNSLIDRFEPTGALKSVLLDDCEDNCPFCFPRNGSKRKGI